MKLDIYFNVTARCKVYPNDNTNTNITTVEDITLTLDKNSAANFVFRFSPNIFVIPGSDYKVLMKYDNTNTLMGIALVDRENTYIVKNFNQLMYDITEGYVRTRLLEKNSAMMEFDFESALDEMENSNAIDEFALSNDSNNNR